MVSREAATGELVTTPTEGTVGASDVVRIDVGIDTKALKAMLVDSRAKTSALVDAGTKPSALVDTGTRPSGLVDAGTKPSGLVDAGTKPSGLVDAGTKPSELVDAGTKPSALVDAKTKIVCVGIKSSSLVDIGTISTLVDVGTKLVDVGTKISDAGIKPSTLVDVGTKPVDTGISPYTLADTGGGSDKPSILVTNPKSRELVRAGEMLADVTRESENEESELRVGIGIDDINCVGVVSGRAVSDNGGVVTCGMGVADREVTRKTLGCDVALVGPTADDKPKCTDERLRSTERNGVIAAVVPTGMGKVVKSMKSGGADVSSGVEVGMG